MNRAQRLKIGAIILFVGALGLSGASMAFLWQDPDVALTMGRLLYAGALANLSLALIMALIAILPLRRGERWAFWAYCLPFVVYGLPILILDATHVAPAELPSTLAPQVGGLLVAAVGLILVAPGVFAEHSSL
jgi:hypothetical protein